MFRALRSRSPAAATAASPSASLRVDEACPPHAFVNRAWTSRLGDWLGASGWRVSSVEVNSSFGQRARIAAVAVARLDFADALHDIHTPAAAVARDRIAIAGSLHELWHFRNEVFDHVSRRHDQAEALRRLSALDRHFEKRARRARAQDSAAAKR
jgi:hypothetical protein